MAISEAPWDGSASRWANPNAYCASCLIDTNTGTKTKAQCHLPVREPGGALSRAGVHAAAAALAGARGASLPNKAEAARKLIRLYGQLDEEPPPSIRRLAAG